MKRLLLLSALFAFAAIAVADGGDDTLRYYTDKAELVAVASNIDEDLSKNLAPKMTDQVKEFDEVLDAHLKETKAQLPKRAE